MKVLNVVQSISFLALLVLMSACNGGGGSGGGDSEPADVDETLEIEYNSYGSYQVTGSSLDLMGTYDEQRALEIPQFLSKIQDTANSLQVGDIARIKFVDTNCDWLWNGTQFEFDSCDGGLSQATYGDTIYLHDLYNPMNVQRAGQIDFGVVRNPMSNHTGTIRIKAVL